MAVRMDHHVRNKKPCCASLNVCHVKYLCHPLETVSMMILHVDSSILGAIKEYLPLVGDDVALRIAGVFVLKS